MFNLNIGGKALFYAQITSESQLFEILKWKEAQDLKVRILGRGTNILMEEDFFEELIIKMDIDYIIPQQDFTLKVGAGTPLAKLINFCVKHKLKGLESLWGIPGSVGGAIVKNASTKWGEISERLIRIKVMDLKAKSFILPKNKLTFSYRDSGIKDLIVYEAEFKLDKEYKTTPLIERIKRFAEYRRLTQPLEERNSGCVFKNSLEFSAGELIEKAGLKGYRIGKVSVSSKHANFFIVENNARFSEFYKLMEFVKDRVRKKTGIELEPDLVIWKR